MHDTLSPFGMSWHLEYVHRNCRMSEGKGSTETLHPVQTLCLVPLGHTLNFVREHKLASAVLPWTGGCGGPVSAAAPATAHESHQ